VTLTINWPDLSSAATKALGLKGKVSFGLDEIILGTVKLADYSESPYAVNPKPGVNSGLQAAVAARFSGLLVQAPANAVTRFERIDFINTTAGALDFTVNWLSPLNFALITVNSTTNFRASNAMQQTDPGGARLGTTVSLVEHTATLGQGFFLVTIPAAGSFTFEIRDGFALYGNDPLGLGGLVMWCETLNEPIRATMHINEYKLPG